MTPFEMFRRQLSAATVAGVELASARPDEVGALIELVREPKLARAQALPPAAAAEGQLCAALGQAEQVALAVRPRGQPGSAPIGVLWCHGRARELGWDCYVDEIALAPGWRQRGLGSALLQAVAELARSAGASHLGLDQMADNPDVGRLYARLGLQRVGHDLRCAAPFSWHGQQPGALAIRTGAELDLNDAASWLARSGALDSLDQPELPPAAIAAQLRHSLEQEAGVLRVAFSAGEPLALSWYEPRKSKAGDPILVFRALAALAPATAPGDEAGELQALLARCARDDAALTARAAFATVWGPAESATFRLLSRLGFAVGRLKWRRRL